MIEALELPFFQRVLAAGLLASVACGIVGSYVVARRISTLAGGVSHAAFGGVGLGYWLGFPPMVGAAAFGGGSFAHPIAKNRVAARSTARAIRLRLISMVWSAVSRCP